MQSNYADVILDITHANVDRPFTYAVPEEMRDTIRPGMPVKLPFGSGNRVRTGWVIALYETAPEVPWELKEILGPAEKQVSAESSLIALALWMHEHYGCMLSQALKTVMPVKSRVKKRKTKTPSSLPGDSSGGTAEGTAERHHVTLNEEQAEAVRQFREDRAAGRRSTFLLFGITGSGKTEVYAEMIREVLGKGQQAILLIPEISLTFQTVHRLEGIFGERVAIIHSRLTQGERYEQFRRAAEGEADIMIGPRSAVFAPFSRLGLIVVDEEHDGAYKSDTVPRYDTREVAEKRAELSGASVVVPLLRDHYGLSYDLVGTLLALLSVGNLLSSFICGFLPRRLGVRKTALIFTSGLFLGYLMLVLFRAPFIICLAFLVIGLGKGSTMNNATVAAGSGTADKTKSTNFINATFALGSLMVPVLYTAAGRLPGWKGPLCAFFARSAASSYFFPASFLSRESNMPSRGSL